MDTLLQHFPKTFNNYYEPFLGGGSVVMELFNNGLLSHKSIFLSDIMTPLMNMYEVVKMRPEELIEELSKDIYQNNQETYLEMRRLFNEMKRDNRLEDKVKLASLFIFLNKTGYNGMYRENRKGEYNIPFGRQKNPMICCVESIRSLHLFLNTFNLMIECCSYDVHKPNKDDFIYLDPPYYNTFTGYNQQEFGETEQRRLKEYYVELTRRKCKVALSNSNDPFIQELYKDFKIIEIPVKRMINSKASDRKKYHTELLILNY